MKKFKVFFPGSYDVKDVYNDNHDLNIILEDGRVFFATFFTPENINNLIKKEEFEYFFWAVDMCAIRDLKKSTIRKAVEKIIDYGIFENVFDQIGTIDTVFKHRKITYDDFEDYSSSLDLPAI